MRRSHNGRPDACQRQDGKAKCAFGTLEQAKSHLERLTKVTRTGAPLRVYLCPKCHRWHVGKPGRRRGMTGGGWK